MKLSIKYFYGLTIVFLVWLIYLTIVIAEQDMRITGLHLRVKRLSSALDYSHYGNEDRPYLDVTGLTQ